MSWSAAGGTALATAAVTMPGDRSPERDTDARLAAIEAEIYAKGEAVPLPANRKGAKSEMVITVKGDPTVVKTELKGAGDPDFPARMNAGGQ